MGFVMKEATYAKTKKGIKIGILFILFVIIPSIIKALKGASARLLFQDFPQL